MIPPQRPQTKQDLRRLPFFYGWVIVAVSSLGMVASVPGQTMGIGVFTDHLGEALSLSRTQLTVAFLVGTAASGFGLPFGGRLFDQVGARRFLTAVALVFGLCVAGFAFVDHLSRALEAVLGAGAWVAGMVASVGFASLRFLGQGLLTIGARSVLMKWWNHRRGLVTAISGVVVAFGFSVAPRVLNWEIESFGWRAAFLLNGLVLALPVAALFWLTTRDSPEEHGLQMDGGFEPVSSSDNPDLVYHRDLTRSEAIRTPAFWILSLTLGFHALYFTAYTFHVLDLARELSVGASRMLDFFIHSAFVSVLTNLTVGWAIDRIRLRWAVVIMGLGGAAASGGLLALPSGSGAVLVVVGMGLSWGCFPVLHNVAFARFFGRAHLGAIGGAAMTLLVWASAVGPLAFSLGREMTGSYRSSVLGAATIFLVLGVLGLLTRNPQRTLGPPSAPACPPSLP